MPKRTYAKLAVAAAFLVTVSLGAKKAPATTANDAPAATTGAGAAAAGGERAAPRTYFKLTGENCYLVFGNYGLFGASTLQTDYGFHYNVGLYAAPERYEGLYSWSNSPSLVNYNNFVEATTTMPDWLALPSGASSITVRYWAKWDIETDYDGVELEIAESGQPTNWVNLHPTSTVLGSGQMGQPSPSRYYYEGYQSNWKEESVTITSYAGKSVKLQFHFRSDTSNLDPHKGIYIDQFRVIRDGTTTLYSDNFNTVGVDEWDFQVIKGSAATDGWGFSQALPAECNFLKNGELLVGNATSYVCDPFQPDWEPTEVGWNTLVHYSNAATRTPSQPEYRVEQWLYAYDDYIIVDCYVKNGKPETAANIYVGLLMDIDIAHNTYERADDDHVIYKSARDYALFYDDGQLDKPVCALAYLGVQGQTSSSVNFVNSPSWTGDAVNYGLLSNGTHQYNGAPSGANYWAVVMGKGPYTLNQSQVIRFAFALLAADDERDMDTNVGRARATFPTLPDRTPVAVEPASFGKIKSLFR